MRSVAPHCALHLLRTVWPDLSAEGKYLLVQIVLRFGGEWVVWTIERLSRELGMSRAAVIRAREELLMLRFRGGGNFIEKKAFPGLSASDPDMLRGRPRIGIRLAEKLRLWLDFVRKQPIGSYGGYIEQLLLVDIGGGKAAGRKPGRPSSDSYKLATSGRLLLAVLWAKAGDGAVVANTDDENLASLTGLSLAKVRYQLVRLRKMGYLEYQRGASLGGYVPGGCPQIIILNQYHLAYSALGALKSALVSSEPIHHLWSIYVHADESDEDLIKEMLRSWVWGLPSEGRITLDQHDGLVEVFKGHPRRSQATKYVISKACEYALVLLCSHSDSLKPEGKFMVDKVCSRIEIELFSHPELNERFGPNTSKLLVVWVYAQVWRLARSVCNVICAMEDWDIHDFWDWGWHQCRSVSLVLADKGRLGLRYIVVPMD